MLPAQGIAEGPAWSGFGGDGAFPGSVCFFETFGTAPQGSGGVTITQKCSKNGCDTSWYGLVGVVGCSLRSFPALMIP